MGDSLTGPYAVLHIFCRMLLLFKRSDSSKQIFIDQLHHRHENLRQGVLEF